MYDEKDQKIEKDKRSTIDYFARMLASPPLFPLAKHNDDIGRTERRHTL